MRYQPHIQHLETEGFGETRSYSIAATGKAFRNLMDGLYSRKVEAVVREISTNALDSHIAAGCPTRQFRVHLPNTLRPTFSVRDYGTGMSHELVMNLYSTLFQSTKDTTNEENGMLGLGSKSPFAYTDGFTLRCWDGEVRRTYSSYLGDGGVPLISVADISASTEPSGVEVSFPVKIEDCEQFQSAARRVYVGFPRPPLGLSEGILRDIRVQPDKTGAGWAMLASKPLPTADAWALQGCVLYPVELSNIVQDTDLISHLRRMSGQLVLDFDMGQLEFTPGRETLSYTEHTKKSISTRWAQFCADMTLEIEEDFRDCTTDWQRAVRANEKGLVGLYAGFFRFSSFYDIVRGIDKAVENALPYERNWNYDASKHVFSAVTVDGNCSRFRKRSAGYPRKSYHGSHSVLWVERSTGVTAPNRRIAHHLEQIGGVHALVWDEPLAPAKRPDLTKFGNPPVLRTKDLDLPPPKPRAVAPRADFKRYRVKKKVSGYQQWTHVEEEQLPAKCEYLFLQNERIVQPQLGTPAGQWPERMRWDQLDAMLRLRLPHEPEVVLVRLRSNEVYARWKKLPLLQDNSHAVVANLTPGQVCGLTRIRNFLRFKQTFYYQALRAAQSQLRNETRVLRRRTKNPEATVPTPRNPLMALQRFEQHSTSAVTATPDTLLSLMHAFTPAMEEELSQRALALGVEVLPPPCEEEMPYPLLPLRWENMARMLAAQHSQPYSLSTLFGYID